MKKRICKMIAAMMATVMLCSVTVCAAGNSVADILNAAVVTPTDTPSGSQPLDEMITYLLSQLTTPEMTTYDKAKACYDWLIAYMQYGTPGFDLVAADPLSFVTYGDYIGYVALASATGVCDDYSYIYSEMLKAIGLNSYLVSGKTHKASGGYTGHTWVVANIDGIEYVFDPQIEDNIAKGGAIAYYRFCKTYAQVPDKYIPYDPQPTTIYSADPRALQAAGIRVIFY